VDGAQQLRLGPHTEFAGDDPFAEIRLWYRRGEDARLLPVMARTRNDAGDASYIMLDGLQANEPVPPEKTSTATPEGGGWDIQIERWKDQGAGE
jgi:hypothetical protein